MTIEFGDTYNGWRNQEFSSPKDQSQDLSASQCVDHGSVSFGRFAVESLSWEKRSVFSVNRRQEELQKFSSYGLVSQKKAYFEEYYKRLRAMKASEDEQQTVLNIDYGEDVSITNQFAVEDEKSEEEKYFRDENEHITGGLVDEFITEDQLENVSQHKADIEAPVPDLQFSSSPKKSFKEVKQEIDSSCIIQIHRSDVELAIDEASEPTIDDIDSLTNCEICVVDRTAPASLVNLNPRNLKRAEVSNITRQKVTVKENTPIKKPKDTASLMRKTPKSDKENKPVLKSSSGTKEVEKTMGKTVNTTRKNNAAAPNLWDKKFSSIATYRSLHQERRTNTTIPCPFSFATERRAAGYSRRPTDSSLSTMKSMSSQIHPENTTHVQSTVKLRSSNLALNSKKQQRNISVDGKNTRQEKPMWR